jgi:Delta3-Delta2-enoyl-CoA isomerase
MIVTTDHGPIRELRLDRPPANALSPELVDALSAAIASAPGEGVRALVLSGASGMFSAGLDVPQLLTFDRPAIRELWKNFYAMLRGIAASPVPVAAAITGHAPAGGAVISLFCDYRVMAEGDFKIGLNEVQVGIPLPPVIHRALRRLLGSHRAERLAVGATLLPAAEALRVGFVDELAPGDQVAARAAEWCQRLLAFPPEAMTETRRLARADLVAFFDGTEDELDLMTGFWFNPETQGALRALVERLAKRKS